MIGLGTDKKRKAALSSLGTRKCTVQHFGNFTQQLFSSDKQGLRRCGISPTFTTQAWAESQDFLQPDWVMSEWDERGGGVLSSMMVGNEGPPMGSENDSHQARMTSSNFSRSLG